MKSIKGLDKALKDMKARSKAFKGGKPYDLVGNLASKSITTNFNSSGRPRWRARNGNYSHPILDKSGDMRDSAELSATRWIHGSVWHIDSITGPRYGFFHQYSGIRTKIGGSIKKIVRKYVVFQKNEIEAMKQVFRDAFLRK